MPSCFEGTNAMPSGLSIDDRSVELGINKVWGKDRQDEFPYVKSGTPSLPQFPPTSQQEPGKAWIE